MEKGHASFDVVHHADVSVCVAAVDEWQFDGGADVTAVEYHKQRTTSRQRRYKRFVQLVAVYLPRAFKVDGHDGVVETRVAVPVGVFNLPAVAGIVEEVAGVGFGDEPVHGGEDVFAGGEEGAARVGGAVVAHYYLGAWVAGVAFEVEELHHVCYVLLAASECVLGAHVVDTNQ